MFVLSIFDCVWDYTWVGFLYLAVTAPVEFSVPSKIRTKVIFLCSTRFASVFFFHSLKRYFKNPSSFQTPSFELSGKCCFYSRSILHEIWVLRWSFPAKIQTFIHACIGYDITGKNWSWICHSIQSHHS